MNGEVIEVGDYAVDGTWRQAENNNLLNDEGEPNPDITNPRHVALASLATAVRRHARMLTASQTEQNLNSFRRAGGSWTLLTLEFSRDTRALFRRYGGPVAASLSIGRKRFGGISSNGCFAQPTRK